MKHFKQFALLFAIIALAVLGLIANPLPVNAGGKDCIVDPSRAPVGTNFHITCFGFDPHGPVANIYATEPDGRASGLNIYGFFPQNVKVAADGSVSFTFVTEIDPLFSVGLGPYTFVVQQLVHNGGGVIAHEEHAQLMVQGRPEAHVGASLSASVVDYDASFFGSGYAPFEFVNIWVTQPPASSCSGLGIDQLTLGTLAGNGSSLWNGPGTVKADAGGNIAFAIIFRSSACVGTYGVTARGISTGNAGEAFFTISKHAEGPSGNAFVAVDPNSVVAIHSRVNVEGFGFPANSFVSCWFTRPDGRVLSFISFDVKTDGGGSFGATATLDDFPPFTSTEPGTWIVTCANNPDHRILAMNSFTVHALPSDP